MLRNWTGLVANHWNRASLTIYSVTITDYGNAKTLRNIYLDLFVCRFSAVSNYNMLSNNDDYGN